MSEAKLRFAGRDQVEMQLLSLDQLLPAEHLAREIWAYVAGMDVRALEEKVASLVGHAGAPAFDPRTLLCLWLYATVDSVGSARRLARLVQESLPYRWIAGGEAINYHTLADFRTAHGAVLDRLLTASVALLAHEGRIDLENMTVAHDGVRVRAGAGRDSLHRRPTLQKALAAAQAHVERMKRQENDPADPPPSAPRRRAAQERAARERVQRLSEALQIMDQLESKQRLRSDRQPRAPRVSSTDPDAAMLRMANGGKDPAHNLQFTTEVRTRAITAVLVAERSSDTGLLAPALENHRRAHGRLPRCALADRGFFKYADIVALEAQNCAVLMPDLYPKSAYLGGSRGEARKLLTRWRERMKTGAAKEQYKLRSSTVEWSNACVRRQGLQQLTVRGRPKVLAIGLLHALAHNILRTLALRKEALAIAA